MWFFYIDDSEFFLSSGKEVSSADVIILGGIGVSSKARATLIDEIRETKCEQHSLPNGFPLKWNFKDQLIREACKERGVELDRLLEDSDELRLDVLRTMYEVDPEPIVIVSVLLKQNTSKNREELIYITLTNLLQRISMEMKKRSADFTQVIFDWPSGEERDSLLQIYRNAYEKGKDKRGNKYYIGSLNNLNFCQSLFFTATKSSELLQLADLSCGATRFFLEHCLKDKHSKENCKFFYEIRDFFRSSEDDTICQYGLVLSPSKVKEEIEEYL